MAFLVKLATKFLVFIVLISQGIAQLQAVPAAACNPSLQTCTPNPAVGGSLIVNFTQGASDEFFTWAGPNATYNASGAYLTMSKAGDTPTISSKKYILFGHVKIILSKCRGGGTISDIVLQSDVLDEVDFNSWGSKGGLMQTNWFGMGFPGPVDRVLNVPDGDAPDGFNTYEVDWDQHRILWTINGKTVRILTKEDVPSSSRYPQTPMAVRMGIWAPDANDTSAVQWAGAAVDWSQGPYSMIIKYVEMVDYSTGTSYNYSNNDGNLDSIVSSDGVIDGNVQAQSTLTATAATTTSPSGQSSQPTSIPLTNATSFAGTPSQSPSSSAPPTVVDSNNGLSTGAKVGIAVGVVVASLLIMLVTVVFWRRRRARQRDFAEKQGLGEVIDTGPGVAVDPE